MPYANNRGIKIYYKTEGDGPPLVLHHWSFATHEDWYDYGFVAGLKSDFRLILLDARGHGASDKPGSRGAYDLKNRVGDVVAVLDDLGLQKAHFFGYSMGAWVAFGIGRYAPERFDSLIIGGQHAFEQSLHELRELLRIGVDNGPKAFIAMWQDNFGPLSPRQQARFMEYDLNILLTVAQDRKSLTGVLPTIVMPCLVIVGEMDEVYSAARQSASLMPNAEFIALPGLGHGEGLQRSDLIIPHIKRFLNKVGPYRL